MTRQRRIIVTRRADFRHCPPVDHARDLRQSLAPVWRWQDRVTGGAIGLMAMFIALRLLT